MRRVLITGANSYIGTMTAQHLDAFPDRFVTRTLDLRGDWTKDAFDGFDAVVHVAGVAHRRERAGDEALYFSVNRDLAVDTARLAKSAGVRQFIFLSSMSVYGLGCGRIAADTPERPRSAYGRSKLEAERCLMELADDAFRVAILRPPMVYGPGCKGNYPRLSALIRKLPAFPRVRNERSMLYIGCLCAFLRRLLEDGGGGRFFPQNSEYVTTDELARQIALANHKRLWQPRGLGWLLSFLAPRAGVLSKVFGTLTYDKAMSAAFADEPQPPFSETIWLTEVGS